MNKNINKKEFLGFIKNNSTLLVTVIFLSVIFVIIFVNNKDNKKLKSEKNTSVSSNVKNNSNSNVSKTVSSAPVVTQTKVNSDGTITKVITQNIAIPYDTTRQDYVNLKKGTTSVVQAGKDGSELIVYSTVYDSRGNELSRTKLSDTVTINPINQILNVGTSDFNLNTDTFGGSDYGLTCLASEYDASNDGCYNVSDKLDFFDITISSNKYIVCISQPSLCYNYYFPGQSLAGSNLSHLIPIPSNSMHETYSYNGNTYITDPRKGGGGIEPLTQDYCHNFGLSCGSW